MLALAATSTDRLLALLPFILPLALVDIGLIVYALVDLFKSERQVRGGSKVVWALIILIFSTFGPLAYLFFGRKDI
ncbi:MAG: PLD nuclease N-terminal domain-containing protein [Ktedonobacterales bacterium]